MGQVWSREDWNKIIRQVNDLCQNPDPGCGTLDPLDEVDKQHIWSKDDIKQVCDKLQTICKDDEFAHKDDTLWKQKIIDEINDAITKGWCDCCSSEVEHDIVLLSLQDLPPYHTGFEDSDCNNCNWNYHYENIQYHALAPMVNGLQVATPPIRENSLTWTIVRVLDGQPVNFHTNGDCNDYGCKRKIYGSGYVDKDGKLPSAQSYGFHDGGNPGEVDGSFISMGILEVFGPIPPGCTEYCHTNGPEATGWSGGRVQIEIRCVKKSP